MAADGDCRLGVLAFGDSITNGGGELQWGVALQSWALWVARGVGLPYTGFASNGARARDVVERQISAFQTLSARPHARYEIGCVYIGVNDVRAQDFSLPAFERDFGLALRFITERSDRTLTVLIPHDLGRPRAAGRVSEANEAIERQARDCGALVLDLRAFRARNLVMADRVHPTAFGQIAIAERALELLRRDGVPTIAHPSSLISWETTWRGRLRGDATYTYRYLKARGRAAIKRAVTIGASAERSG
jgi:lysophospholipase L1-like esterase